MNSDTCRLSATIWAIIALMEGLFFDNSTNLLICMGISTLVMVCGTIMDKLEILIAKDSKVEDEPKL